MKTVEVVLVYHSVLAAAHHERRSIRQARGCAAGSRYVLHSRCMRRQQNSVASSWLMYDVELRLFSRACSSPFHGSVFMTAPELVLCDFRRPPSETRRRVSASVSCRCCRWGRVRPTPFLPASLVWWPVYSGPQTFFRPRSWSGQNNGGGVFLRISAVREDGAGVLSGGGCSRVVVLSVAEAVFELNASTEA